MSELRQRFYIEDCPIRGEVVHLEKVLQTILAQRDYPQAIEVCWVKCSVPQHYWPVH